MKAEIIAVGTEILLGQIVNTNAVFLSEYLTNLGFDIYHQQVVGDNEDRLLNILEESSKRSDLIVLTGGLGPTEDDLTKQTTAKFVGKELHYDSDAMAHLVEHFSATNREVTENNKRQALTIKGARTIQNPAGLACGCLVEYQETFFLLLPAPPREMKAMAEQEAKPLLKELLPNQGKLISRYLRYIGIGESGLAQVLSDLIQNQTNPTIAPYAKMNEVMLRITANAMTKEEGIKLLDEMENQINELVGEYFYGYGENLTMESVVIELLKEKHQTLSVVEGLTGGLCQTRLTDCLGSSQVFEGGLVTYTAKSKETLLKLEDKAKAQEGSISKEHAGKLAESIRRLMGTDYGLSLIGVGGPEPIEGQPVGTIFIGLATKEKTLVEQMMIKRERDYIKDGAVKHGLNLLRKELL